MRERLAAIDRFCGLRYLFLRDWDYGGRVLFIKKKIVGDAELFPSWRGMDGWLVELRYFGWFRHMYSTSISLMGPATARAPSNTLFIASCFLPFARHLSYWMPTARERVKIEWGDTSALRHDAKLDRGP